MIFDLYPWKVDFDIESTKEFYKENNLSIDTDLNEKFKRSLHLTHKQFFENIGVDILKVRVEEIESCPDENGNDHKLSVDFLVCGKFLTIAEFQKEIYGNIEEFKDDVEKVDVLEYDFPPFVNIDDMGCGVVFKHPSSKFDFKGFEKWDCGYICGSVII